MRFTLYLMENDQFNAVFTIITLSNMYETKKSRFPLPGRIINLFKKFRQNSNEMKNLIEGTAVEAILKSQ